MPNYLARIVDTALAESKEKKTPSVKLSLETVKDLDTGIEVQRKFYADLWLSDKAIERTAQTLADIGCPCTSFEELNYGNPMGGMEVEISTDWEEYEGKEREKVAFVNPVGSYANRGMKKADDSFAKSVASRYDAALRNAKKRALDKEAEGLPF